MLCGVLIAITPLAPAMGQGPEEGLPRSEVALVTEAHIDEMAAFFGLNDAQVVQLEELYEGFDEAYVERRTAHRLAVKAALEAAEESDDWGASDEVRDEMNDGFTLQRTEMVLAFYDDARLLLTKEQVERWGAWERARIRFDELPRTVYPEDSIDLIAFVRDQAPQEDAPTITGLLAAYEADMHELLLERARARVSTYTRIASMNRYDPNDLERLTRSAREASWAVAELNRSTAASLFEAMDPSFAPQFQRLYEDETRPWMHARRGVIHTFERLATAQVLDEKQRERIGEIRADYDRRYTDLINTIRQTEVEAERQHATGHSARPPREYLRVLVVPGRGGVSARPLRPGAEALVDFVRALTDLDTKTQIELGKVLTDEQLQQLRVTVPTNP